MPRVPVRIQPSGVSRFSSLAAAGRSVPQASIRQTGPALSREHFDDRRLNAIQDKVNTALSIAKGNPFADGNLIEGVTFVANTLTPVYHNLGSTPRGYFVLNIIGNAASFVRIPEHTDAQFLVLGATLDCTADIWIYI